MSIYDESILENKNDLTCRYEMKCTRILLSSDVVIGEAKNRSILSLLRMGCIDNNDQIDSLGS